MNKGQIQCILKGTEYNLKAYSMTASNLSNNTIRVLPSTYFQLITTTENPHIFSPHTQTHTHADKYTLRLHTSISIYIFMFSVLQRAGRHAIITSSNKLMFFFCLAFNV